MPAARFLIFCLLVIFVDQTDSSAGESNLTFNRINFKLGDKKDNNRTWGQNVSSGIINVYYASLDSKEYELDLIRVRATLTDGSSSFRSGLLQVTASNGRDSVALTVPQLYKNSDQWLNSAVRIMCPILGEDINKPNDATDGNPVLAVSVMTTSIAKVHYDLYVDIYDRAQFFVRLPTKSKEEALSVTRNDKVAYNDPLAYRIDLRGYEIQQQPLKISVISDDDICAVLAVQNFSCPLCQTAFDAIQTSLHLTFTRHAMLTIDPSTMLSNFTILFFVYPDDSPCGFHTTRNAIEKKKILVKFESERPKSYSWPILAFCSLFGAFYLVYFLETIVAKIRPMLKHQSPNVLSVRYHDDDGAEQISSQQIPPFLVNAEEARCADQQPSSTISKTELLLQLSSEVNLFGLL
uniref:C2H2-type domain-containing protein n=1 Tax=Plectus sambesii TaxID=2011161 RepID=A0A914W743_9BILA